MLLFPPTALFLFSSRLTDCPRRSCATGLAGNMMFLPFLVGALPLLLYLLWKASQMGKRDPRLPPGPPTIPILGNAHMLPTSGIGKK